MFKTSYINNKAKYRSVKISEDIIDNIYSPDANSLDRTLYIDLKSGNTFTIEHMLSENPDLSYEDEKELIDIVQEEDDYVGIKPLTNDYKPLLFDEFLEDGWEIYLDVAYKKRIERLRKEFKQNGNVDQIRDELDENFKAAINGYIHHRSKEILEKQLRKKSVIVEWT